MALPVDVVGDSRSCFAIWQHRRWTQVWQHAAFTLAAALALLSPRAMAEPAPVATPVTVQTPLGSIVGMATAGGERFLGIPYAQPPTGDRRFAAPVAIGPWPTPLDATKARSACLQRDDGAKLGGGEVPLFGDEDCLFLNIDRPAPLPGQRTKGASPTTRASALPVMVWIHGGAFVSGAGTEYDGSYLAQTHQVIVVTLNYRLGPLGFLAHPGLSGDNGQSGNYGLLDQQEALRWVRRNIASFGGDPSRITVFGESAGALSICYQLTMPSSEGLFDQAILESGPCSRSLLGSPKVEAQARARVFAASAGCFGPFAASCLKSKSAADLVRAAAASPDAGTAWGAVYGNDLIPEAPQAAFRAGHFRHLPILNGTNHDEGRLFALIALLAGVNLTAETYALEVRRNFPTFADDVLATYPVSAYATPALAYSAVATDSIFSCPADQLNQALARGAPVWAYEFNDPAAPSSMPTHPALPSMGAYHAAEITYVFQTKWGLADPAAFSPPQKRLAQAMGVLWTAFAKSGRPSAVGAPAWPTYTAAKPDILTLAPLSSLVPTAMAPLTTRTAFADDHRCALWDAHEGTMVREALRPKNTPKSMRAL